MSFGGRGYRQFPQVVLFGDLRELEAVFIDQDEQIFLPHTLMARFSVSPLVA
jgi:hypothetical protein